MQKYELHLMFMILCAAVHQDAIWDERYYSNSMTTVVGVTWQSILDTDGPGGCITVYEIRLREFGPSGTNGYRNAHGFWC